MQTLASLSVPGGLVGGPFGSSLTSADYTETGVPVIRGSNMTATPFIQGPWAYVSEAKFADDLSRNCAIAGDLIYTQRGTLGQVGRVPDGWSTVLVVSQSQMRLRVNRAIADPAYIYYASIDQPFLKQVRDYAISTGVPHINLGILGRLQVPLPHRRIQGAIAEVLGALDEKIAANDKLRGTATAVMDARYISGVVHAAQRASIGDLIALGAVALGDGYRTKSSELQASGYRIIRAGDVDGDRVHLSGSDFVGSAYGNAIGPKEAKVGDVIVTTKGTVGRSAVVRHLVESATYSPQICYLRVIDKHLINRYQLAGWVRSRDFQDQLTNRMHRSDMAPYVSLSDFRSISIPLTEGDIRHRVSNELAVLDEMLGGIDQEIEQLTVLRDTLLPALMSGRLRVRDAEQQIGEVL